MSRESCVVVSILGVHAPKLNQRYHAELILQLHLNDIFLFQRFIPEVGHLLWRTEVRSHTTTRGLWSGGLFQ